MGVGCYLKMGKKKGGIKVYINIYVNEGVFLDIRFIFVVINDSFMFKLLNYISGDIVVLDRVYIDYVKFEELSWVGVIYVIKMKKNFVYEVFVDMIYMIESGLMVFWECYVIFMKKVKDGDDIKYYVCIVIYVD